MSNSVEEDVQILLFGTDGKIRAYESCKGKPSLTIQVPPINLKCFMFCNTHDLSHISEVPELMREHFLLHENTKDYIASSGFKLKYVQDNYIELDISPIACRIIMDEIVIDFDKGLENTKFKLKAAYLLNAKAYVNFAGFPGNLTSVLNHRKFTTSHADKIISKFWNESIILANNVIFPCELSFVCLANQSRSLGKNNYTTALVVEAELDGLTHYYPIYLPDIQAGKIYHIHELRITGPGALEPLGLGAKCKATDCSVTILDWKRQPQVDFEY